MIPFEQIKQKALELGWDDAGVTEPQIPEQDAAAYQEWIANGMHADLAYMEKEIRCRPDQLFPGAKSAIIFVSYYKQEPRAFKKDAGLIASYARGRDYHNVHRKRLKRFIRWLEETAGKTGIAKGFSDSSPVLEKALAVQAGLGWFGKNTLLIHRKYGTFTLLSGLLTTEEIGGKVVSLSLPRCGSCQRCMDACPTQALVSPYRLDAAKCLSYHLIESKKELPETIKQQNPGYIFGCDICQDACPHNTRKKPSEHESFKPESGMGPYLEHTNLRLLEKEPETLYGTPLQRKGVQGLIQNFASLAKISELE